MRLKTYTSPSICRIQMDAEHPVMASSVIDQNSMIKAADQEVNYVDFSDDTSFKLDWE